MTNFGDHDGDDGRRAATRVARMPSAHRRPCRRAPSRTGRTRCRRRPAARRSSAPMRRALDTNDGLHPVEAAEVRGNLREHVQRIADAARQGERFRLRCRPPHRRIRCADCRCGRGKFQRPRWRNCLASQEQMAMRAVRAQGGANDGMARAEVPRSGMAACRWRNGQFDKNLALIGITFLITIAVLKSQTGDFKTRLTSSGMLFRW